MVAKDTMYGVIAYDFLCMTPANLTVFIQPVTGLAVQVICLYFFFVALQTAIYLRAMLKTVL